MKLGDKQYYRDLFNELIEQYEFEIVKTKDEDGNDCLKLKDLQGGNLGNIEDRKYNDYAEILDDLDTYHNDYLVKYVSDCVYEYCDTDATWQDLVNAYFEHIDEFDGDCEWEARMLDLVVNSEKLKGIKE